MCQRSFFKTNNEESRFSRTELGIVEVDDQDLASFGVADYSQVDVPGFWYKFVDFRARRSPSHELGAIESGFDTDRGSAVERTRHIQDSQGQILALAFR